MPTPRDMGMIFLEDAVAAGMGSTVLFLEPGIYFVEIVPTANIGPASVQIGGTCRPTDADFKVEEDLTLDATTAGGMIRGGRNVIANVVGTPTAAISVYIAKASD